MNRFVIASAAFFETGELVSNLRHAGLDVTHLVVGVGLTEASIVSARLRDLVSDRHVIFCCTGGILGVFQTVEIYQAGSVHLAPQDVREGHSYLLSNFDPPIFLKSLSLGLPECTAAGSVGVSLIESGAQDLSTPFKNTSSEAATLETIELYGVARAWHGHAKSLTAIIASTNAVGPSAHQDWQRNFKLAAQKTATLVAEKLLKIHGDTL